MSSLRVARWRRRRATLLALAALMACLGLLGSHAGVARADRVWSAPVPVDVLNQGQQLNGASCPSQTQCTGVDDNGYEVTFDPVAPGVPTPVAIDPTGRGLEAVACVSTTLCVAVDASGRAVTFDPLSPGDAQVNDINTNQGLYGIDCTSASQCTAVGSGDEVTFDPADVGSPTPVAISGGYMYDVACPTSDQCTAVTRGYDVITFDPQSPSDPAPVVSQIDPSYPLYGIACPTAGLCTAVDNGGNELSFDPTDPGTPTLMPDGMGYGAAYVSCAPALHCTIVGGNGVPSGEVTFDPQSSGPFDPVTIDYTGGAFSW
ncbi:MAG: hypothetical protein ACRDNS_14470, partial [Trebonia sp.]